ncbi:MAG: sigma-70 family RNA polymerase sigma factor, partial [Pseudoxanthomonas sp.]
MLTSAVTFATDPIAPDTADADLAQARSAASGDTRAFEALYRKHVGRVHGVIVRLVGAHGARAEDLTQETFVRVWRALPEFRFESALSTWLHRMAVNTALMELRSRRSGPRWEDEA